jgi:hypothetical protein
MALVLTVLPLEAFHLWICPTMTNNELNSMLYFIRLKQMDRVGVEPTTSAMCFLTQLFLSPF